MQSTQSCVSQRSKQLIYFIFYKFILYFIFLLFILYFINFKHQTHALAYTFKANNWQI